MSDFPDPLAPPPPVIDGSKLKVERVIDPANGQPVSHYLLGGRVVSELGETRHLVKPTQLDPPAT